MGKEDLPSFQQGPSESMIWPSLGIEVKRVLSIHSDDSCSAKAASNRDENTFVTLVNINVKEL